MVREDRVRLALDVEKGRVYPLNFESLAPPMEQVLSEKSYVFGHGLVVHLEIDGNVGLIFIQHEQDLFLLPNHEEVVVVVNGQVLYGRIEGDFLLELNPTLLPLDPVHLDLRL